MTDSTVPLRIHRTDDALTVHWDKEHVGTYPARALRVACPCAGCRDEMTGRRVLDPATIPDGIRPLAVSLVGSYAIRIEWSDGHSTGIYTYETLRQSCPCPACTIAAQR